MAHWTAGRRVSARTSEKEEKETMTKDETDEKKVAENKNSAAVCAWRLRLNVENTGHPFHHKAADGTILDGDPSLEKMLARLVRDDVVATVAMRVFDPAAALPTVPVDRARYGVEREEAEEHGVEGNERFTDHSDE